jgi:glycine cleavage system H protein
MQPLQLGRENFEMAYPTNYRYTREHEWIDVSGKTGTVGITDHAQDSLGDIVFVELPKVGDKVERGKVFGSVESVKAVSDLYSPATGTVTAINEELTTAPEKINADAHAAWIMKIELSDPGEIASLMTAQDYETYAKEETGH